MKIYIMCLIMLYVSISCASGSKNKTNLTEHNVQQSDTLQLIRHTDTNILTVFLNIEYAGKVAVFDIPHGKITKYVQNNIEEEDFVMFDLLQKQDSMYYIIAYSGLTDHILAKGWISQNTNLGVYSAAYGDLHCSLYKTPFNRKQIIITEKVYNPNMYEVLDFDGKWLKVRTKINNKFYVGWLPPEMQCANPYTTCS